ncbi:MAG: hypothetical protein WAN48_13685 [Actinomycetes bacterium]
MIVRRLSAASALLAGSLVAASTFAAPVVANAAPKVGSWSSGTAISGVNQPDPTRGAQLNDVAINASGLAVSAWDQYTYNNGGGASIGAAVRSNGRWGAPFVVSGSSTFAMSPKVAVGADGTMAVSWVSQDPVAVSNTQRVQVAVRPAGSSTWTTSTLATFAVSGVAITRTAPLAVDPAGNVTAVWTAWDGTKNIIQSATKPTGQPWSSASTLSGPTTDAYFPSLSVNARGDAAVAYTLSAYGASTGTWAEYVYRAAGSSTWTTPVVVSEKLTSSVGYISGAEVGLDGSGRATVAYFGYGVEATRQLADGTWTTPGPVITSPTSGSSYISPDLGVDAQGNAILAVSIFDSTVNVDRASVWVSRGTPDGSWTRQQRLTDPTAPVDAYATQVAVSPDGALALVGWIDHYHGTVQVSQLVNGAWGAATTIGRGTAFSSFQEMLSLDAASGTVAQAVWKNAKGGTITMASTYRG